MVTRGSPKPLLRVRVLLPLPHKGTVVPAKKLAEKAGFFVTFFFPLPCFIVVQAGNAKRKNHSNTDYADSSTGFGIRVKVCGVGFVLYQRVFCARMLSTVCLAPTCINSDLLPA